MKNKKISKKSQMEILGLAIVIVIVLLAITFAVGFLSKPQKNIRQGFVNSELASNMINTFLKTNAPLCSRLSMTELIQNCFESEGINCDNGQTSCEFVKERAAEIMKGTLDEWHLKYEFSIYTSGQSPKISIGAACVGSKKSKQFPVPSSAATIYVKMDICT